MTMTEPEAAAPSEAMQAWAAAVMSCPRCGQQVRPERTERTEIEGVTVLSIADHDCPGDQALERVEPGTHVEPAVRSAIDAAVEGALAMPGVPGRDEFLSLAAQARMLSLSGGAPKLIREDPYLAFHVVLIGRDLGISPSAAIELIDVIPGRGDKGPQLSLSPQLLNGQIRRLGLGSIVKVQSDLRHCIAVALEPGGRVDWRCKPLWPDHVDPDDPRGPCTCRGIMGDVEFDWAEARMAGLVGANCEPGDHKKGQSGKCGCNQGYITYPKRMHWWRASGYTADDYFPEAGLGLYTAEELGALTDEEGRPIDVTNVELPPGYEIAAPPEPTQADLDTLHDLRTNLGVAILALPDAQRAELRDRWKQTERLANSAPHLLTIEGCRLASSLVKGFEAAARRDSKGEWSQDESQMETMRTLSGVVGALLGWVHGVVPSESPDPGPGPTEPAAAADPAPDQPNAQEAAQGADPAEAFKAQLAGATEAQVDAAIAKVTELGEIRYVDRELSRLRQHAEGKPEDRRRRLGLALLYEALHGGPPPEQIP